MLIILEKARKFAGFICLDGHFGGGKQGFRLCHSYQEMKCLGKCQPGGERLVPNPGCAKRTAVHDKVSK
jgi:hypothetical protein